MKHSTLLILPLTLTLFACETGQLSNHYSEPMDHQELTLSNNEIDGLETQELTPLVPDDSIQASEPKTETASHDLQTDTFISLANEEPADAETMIPPIEETLTLSDEPEDVTVHFGFDSSELSEGDIEQLIQTADFLIANPEFRVDISGFTDQHGARDYNTALSQKRADQVKSILKSRGVPAFQITATGLGSNNPISSVAKLNRRVELKFEKTLFGLIKDSQSSDQPADEYIQ